MSIWIDHQYIGQISNRLLRFKQKDKDLYNFRCPFCLDSQKSKTKARGWIYNKQNKLLFYCHNCGASMLFINFLKAIDPELHSQYIRDKFLEDNINSPISSPKPDIVKIAAPKFASGKSPLRSLKKISALPVNHKAKKYVVSRKIPSHHHYRIFYCERFMAWVNSYIPGKFDDLSHDHPRLILPFIDRDKRFFGCQARSLGSKGVRYITILIDELRPRIFGLDTCDMSKDHYIFEGPIDSLFIENSIAMCGADITALANVDKERSTVVFDNEPRARQIVKRMIKYIDKDYRVCIWPESIKEKDLNDMILAGYDPDELRIIINKNSYSGIRAKLQLQSWRKC